MLEDKSKKVPEGVEEIKDDELEQVAGGYSTVEIIQSREMAIRAGNCPIEAMNTAYKNKK